jgi:2-keto-myo-inositol isomerase
MIAERRFALNRIACPSLGLEDFYALAADIGLSGVELRNDLPGGRIVDGLPPARAAALAERYGLRVISINALQKFNLASARQVATEELNRLLDLAAALRCPAIVLCPNNDVRDARSGDVRLRETVDALAAFAPLFTARGILGYVEPLGFAECSLPSLVTAVSAIKSSGAGCYRTVCDTFHHFIGPDSAEDIGTAYDVSATGLMHVSGVEAGIPVSQYRDPQRVLAGPQDRMDSRRIIARHVELGYTGDISFEPFSPDIQGMPRDALAAAIRTSIAYLRG